MIRITIELLPKGDERHRRHLGSAWIVNDGTGDDQYGNYEITLSKWGQPNRPWKRGIVRGFPRNRFGPWDLLALGLAQILIDRLERLKKLARPVQKEPASHA